MNKMEELSLFPPEGEEREVCVCVCVGVCTCAKYKITTGHDQ